MYSGITGLRNFQDQLDIVANNIANVNTVGYKGSRATFQTTLFQTLSAGNAPQNQLGGTNPMQIGLGSQLASIDKLMTQGSPMSTGKATDLMIQGEGFFILSDGIGQYYTRAGNFTRDYNGFFVDPASGMKLQGWTAKIDQEGNRTIDTNDPIGDIQISSGQVMAAKQTSFIRLAHNLNAGAGIQDTTIVVKSTTGENIPVKFSFKRDMSEENKDKNVYNWTASVVGSEYKFAVDDGSGNLTSTNQISGKVELDDTGNVISWVNYNGNGDPLAESKISIYDINGEIVDVNGAPVSVTTSGTPATLTGSIRVTDNTTGEAVYYDPEDIDINFNDLDSPPDGIADQVEISLNIEGAPVTPVVFTGPASTVADFNNSLTAGIPSGNYTLTGLRLTGASDTDTIDNQDFATLEPLQSVREVIQPPSGGAIRFTDLNNPTNFSEANYISPAVTTSTVVYDSLGNPYNTYLKFTKIDANTWYWKAELEDGTPLYKTTADGQLLDDPAEGVIAFDSNGNIAATQWKINPDGTIDQTIGDGDDGAAGFWFDPAELGAALNPSVDPQSAAGAGPVNVSINFQELSQFFAENSIAVTEQDGNAQGTLDSFAINTNGQIIGSFTNGLTAPLGQVALATFNNPEGLSATGNSMYAMSSNSGLPQVGVSGVGGRGSINPGALEMSNVDLAEEFTNMIIAQRGFQANSRSITTADAILNELVNIKR
jgi:flagellar hook protein FlgE